MPLPALLIVLGAALCHSVWNLILKMEGGRSDVALGALVVGVLLGAPLMATYPLAEIPLAGWVLVVVSALFETGYFLALSAAYRVGDLSLVYPVARGTSPVVVAPLAILFLGERLSAAGLAGVGLVCVGILGGHARGIAALAASATTRRALGLALLTGAMTAGYSLVNKLGVAIVPVPVYGVSVFAVNAVLFALVLRRRGVVLPGPRTIRWRPTLAIGVLMMTAYVAVLAGMSMAPVSYVVATREVSIVVGAALGAIALREPHPVWRLASAAVIFAGLALIALAD